MARSESCFAACQNGLRWNWELTPEVHVFQTAGQRYLVAV
jgi:hypothetical protein